MGTDSVEQVVENATPATPIVENPVESLENVIAESTQTLQAAEAKPIKKGRGRPRKIPDQASPGYATGTGAPLPGGSPAPVPQADLTPILKPAVQMPFEIAAIRTGYEGWRLDEAETNLLAMQVDAIAKEYMPQLSGRWASLVALSLSVAMISGTRFLSYSAWKKEHEKPSEVIGPVIPVEPQKRQAREFFQ